MELRRPRLADKKAVLDMMTEFENFSRLTTAVSGIQRTLCMKTGQKAIRNRKWELICLKDGFLQFSQWLFSEKGQAVGFLNLRLRLSNFLLEEGGHIGYSIRPSERGKGYAKETLRQGLQVAKEKNIKKALVTCSVNNPASRAVILANGGIFEDARNGVERYWIEVANE